MNPCGVAHFPDYPCRECERLRKQAGDAQPEHVPVTTGSSEETGVSKRHDSSGASRGGDIADDAPSIKVESDEKAERILEPPPSSEMEPCGNGIGKSVSPPAKTDRIEDAKQALTAAEKQRRYREKHGEAYREREKARLRMRRKRGG